MQPLVLIPAVQLSGGRVVQLAHERPDGSQVGFRDLGDPVEVVRHWAGKGASWLQIIDTDAARGVGTNTPIITRMVEVAGESGCQVTLSGGVRDDPTLKEALETGATIVTLGTAALERPEWAEALFAQLGYHIAVSLDVRGDSIVTQGWSAQESNLHVTVSRLTAMGCRAFIVRCLDSDGRLSGPNLELLGTICAITRGRDADVVVSGGIGSLEDLRRLRGLVPIGVSGAVVGTALYLDKFSLEDGLAMAEGDLALTGEAAAPEHRG